MYYDASKLIGKKIKDILATKISNWVEEKYPYRNTEFEKFFRDISYVIQALESSIKINSMRKRVIHITKIK